MLDRIMRHIRNYFASYVMSGTFTIANGTIALENVTDGEYIKIENSKLNDGVYKYPAVGLKNETFNGNIVVLNPPVEFLEVCAEIEAYNAQYGAGNPYTSESFGGYSYTRATNGKGVVASWQEVFRTPLNEWRKL